MSETLRLKITSGAAAGKELLVADELVIGREAPGDGMIADDVEISRQHARIARTPQDEWGVEDLGSRNGTFLNGHRIERHELLAAGDSIELGGTRMVVQVSSPATAPAAAPEPEPAAGAVRRRNRRRRKRRPRRPSRPLSATRSSATWCPTGARARAAEAPPSPSPPRPRRPSSADQPAAAVPPLSLTVDLDPAAGEAVISLGPGSDSVRLVFEDGAWRVRPGA